MLDQGALTGLTVIDLSRLLPGPYASMILADHGARVIAIEDRRFMSDNFFVTTVNRNKEHMSLNLKTPRGRDIFEKLLERADVVIEGFRPGVVERLGIDYPTVSSRHPSIIYCSISGYGQTGPYRDRVGHDVNYLATAGVLDLIGPAGSPPSIPGIQIADIAGGGMNAVIGILLALIARNQTGKGQYIDISMTDGMLGFLSIPLWFRELTGTTPQRSDAVLSHRYACYNTYETADGRYISIGAVENRFWKVLCEHFGVPHYTPLQYDDTRREEIIAFMRERFRSKTISAWEMELAPLEICYARVNTLDDVLDHPLFLDRQMAVDQQDASGKTIRQFGIAVKLDQTPGKLRTPPATFGQHTESILAELGYSKSEIESLMREGVV
ncbi:MAG: CaiB/BaiF CoA-transferase family protein [Thermodesulfobacteriota bacterium]